MKTNIGIIIWGIAIYGFITSRNLILMLICLELMLLGISLMLVYYSIQYDDILSLIYSLYIIGIAGAETAIGLSIVIGYYRLIGNVSLI